MTEYRFESKVFPDALLYLVAVCMIVTTSYAQTPNSAGFISIDCGRTEAPSEDSKTGLTWENDDKYISTGINGVVNTIPDKNLENFQALHSFRSFPNNRSKHCYTLNVASGNVTLLIRAMFFLGSTSVAELAVPIEFDVYVNATWWFAVQYQYPSKEDPIVNEGIFYCPGNVAYVCLVPNQGVPFISSLELRPLDHELIAYNASMMVTAGVFLNKLIRWNPGPAPNAPTLRFPIDPYDRLWENPGPTYATLSTAKSTYSSTPPTSAVVNNVPSEVMDDSWIGSKNDSYSRWYQGRYFDIPFNLTFPPRDNGRYLFLTFYFQTLNNFSGQDIFLLLNEQQFAVPNYDRINHMLSVDMSLAGNNFDVQVFSTSNPRGNPILNALEIYEKNIFDPTTTNHNDEDTISHLKESFNMTDWQGDPCTPFPYDELTCEIGFFSPHVMIVTSLIFSNLSNSSGLLIFKDFSLPYLQNVSLTYSHINDSTFDFLIEYLIVNSSTNSLDLSHNDITFIPWDHWSAFMYNKTTHLNLSYNELTGEVPSFLNVTYPVNSSLQNLDLSHNAMTSFPNMWGDSSSHLGLNYLVTLDLSYNAISDDIASLDGLLLKNDFSLKYINISNNNITGEYFNTSYYFSNLTTLTVLNVDHNRIRGVLDLTMWHEMLQLGLHDSKSSILLQRTFSFVNNSITGIRPAADTLGTAIYSLPNDTGGGVLLSGNPYCKGAESYIELYLCRYSVNETVTENRKKGRSTGLIIGATLGGAVVLLVCSILSATIWKLRKDVRSYRSVEKALAMQKVHPPFFLYSDLKRATQDFHKSTILGKGAFGIVYKGKLDEGTPIAVKKLFNTSKHSHDQEVIVNDFLNEVVLINGIKHKNLVQLQGCCVEHKERILVYECAERGNLAEALWGNQGEQILRWEHRLEICVGIASGLRYLHEELQPRIIHRDIKPANVLLDKNFNAKIADFGLAKHFSEDEALAHITQVAGTKGYFAPEYAGEGQLTPKADVYSFGILLLEIISGRKCIDTTLPEDQVFLKSWVELLQRQENLVDLLQPELKQSCPEDQVLKITNIALICVQLDPKFRPTMSQVITMLSGNVDLTDFLKTTIRVEPDFDYLFQWDDSTTVEKSRKPLYKKDEINSPLMLDRDDVVHDPEISGSSSYIARLSEPSGR